MDANARNASVFKELLKRQFPIDTKNKDFKLRSPNDYARQQSVHVNHLNCALKLTTGKTTTTHIAERLANEAKMLLRHSNWNLSEISYVLGFEDAVNFNHFFKKHTS
ncbi:helix-turn-helix domain-containing protein [Rhodocytophaga rosea]|uniref:helix-turn-helix domain-containing protein n=1 Tax=Rhodocytophaga rosea TaxID=2704465 RepID=UPI001E49ED09|nr:helix-turn-helix domain-containing protein [Rhodocytophaga rosea]